MPIMLEHERRGRVGDDDGRVEEEDADEGGDGGGHLGHAVQRAARHRAGHDEAEAHGKVDVGSALLGGDDRVGQVGCHQGKGGVQARRREEHPHEKGAARVVRVLSRLGLLLCVWERRARDSVEVAPRPGLAVAQAIEHRRVIVGVPVDGRAPGVIALHRACRARSARPHFPRQILGRLLRTKAVAEAKFQNWCARCYFADEDRISQIIYEHTTQHFPFNHRCAPRQPRQPRPAPPRSPSRSTWARDFPRPESTE